MVWQIGLGALRAGAGAALKKIVPGTGLSWGQALVGTGLYTIGTEALKNVVANPLLRATGLGQPSYNPHPVPAAPGGMAPGMTPLSGGGMGYGGRYGVMGGGYATGYPTPGAVTPEQFNYLYGDSGVMGTGFMRNEGLYERSRRDEIAAGQRQLETQIQGQRDIANIGQEGMTTRSRIGAGVQRYASELGRDVSMRSIAGQERISELGFAAQRYLSDNQARISELGYSTQRDLGRMNAETAQYGYRTQSDIARIGAGVSKYGMDTQRSIADMTTSRGLAGLRDTNRTQLGITQVNANRDIGVTRINAGRDITIAGIQGKTQVALADRSLAATFDSNRRDVKLADINANRDRYLADRGVEAARWGGSSGRIGLFGDLMSRRF